MNKTRGKIGVCKVGNECLIASEFVHMGEEAHISPSHTFFFMGCPFKCVFCQNWSISQWGERGKPITSRELARLMERRRKEGARNANFVGGEPTPYLPWILETLKRCKVSTPIIWNSDMYMTEETMKILDGIVDMYLSDFKYGNDECALRLSKVKKFFETCSRNHSLAAKTSEITIRHLVLPNHVKCCTKPVLKWIADHIREKAIVNVMSQYRPEYKAHEYSDINRRVTQKEMKEAINFVRRLKLNFIT